MLARSSWPVRYHWFNLRWGAPYGRALRKLVPPDRRLERWAGPIVGCFAFQANNDTRRFEYPWAFEALRPERGLRVLEIGGSLSGFQFVLDKAGCEVTNIDPGDTLFTTRWPITPETVNRINSAFGTDVVLKNCYLQDANLQDASFDRVVSISVFEHIEESVLVDVLRDVRRVLKPGGLLVLTIDLFLNVQPFEDEESNPYGRNLSVKWLVETSGLELVHGEPSELYGYPGFNPQSVLDRRDLLVGRYPTMVQTVVLRKPAGPSPTAAQ